MPIKRWAFLLHIFIRMSGSIKPLKYLNDNRVVSIMVEVNRYLYMNEITGQKNEHFDKIKSILKHAIINVDGFYDKSISLKLSKN